MTPRHLCLSALVATSAFAQVNVDINVTLPTISFQAPPPVVVVEPGVVVVENSPDEVFFVDNWYWVRRDAKWYRTKDHRGGWVLVQSSGVPPTLVKLPPGKYKNWKKGKGEPAHDDHDGDHHDEDHGKGHGNGKKGKK
jgi:hypothetical protein